MEDSAVIYGSLYLDNDETYDMVDKQIESFRKSQHQPGYIFFDVIAKDTQVIEAIAHRAQIVSDLQDNFPNLPLGVIYVAIGFSDIDRSARNLMIKLIEEQNND